MIGVVLPRLTHQGLSSYDIKLNTKYTNIIRAIDGLEKEKDSPTHSNSTNALNFTDEENKALKRPSVFKKK